MAKAWFIILLIVPLLVYGDETSNSTGNATVTTSTVTQASSTTPSANVSTTTVSTTTPSSTTVSTTTQSPPTTMPLPTKRTTFLNTSSYVCSCDSTITCNINCCCDMDCSEEFIKAFRCLEETNMEFYHHGEGLERCTVDNGLFCIIQDNLGSQTYMKTSVYSEYSSYHWMDSPVAPKTKAANEMYKFGDAILTFDGRSETVGSINVPGSSSCWKEPIKFLRSTSANCLKSLSGMCSFNGDILTQLVHSQVLFLPSQTEKKEMTHGFNMKIQSCRQFSFNCTPFDAEAETFDVFDGIHFEFQVNDTNLISGTASLIINDELSCTLDDLEPHAKVVQNFEVKFKNINEKREKRVRTRSRGYKDAELIYISRQFLQNESIPNGNKYLEYFHENDTDIEDFSLKVPKSLDGKCVLTKDDYDMVRFNENSLTFCKVIIEKNETLNETFCQQMQLQLSNYFFGLMNLTFNGTSVSYAENILVSKYYPPNYDAWVKLDILGVSSVSTELQTTANKQFCTNIFREVKFSVYSNRENVIEKLSVELVSADFLLPIDNENQTVSADISIKCQFLNQD